MKAIKNTLRKLTPKVVLDNFHLPEAHVYARKAGYPSRSMIVIGIVGSKGKTTTANYLWSILQAAGHKTGQISTANIRVGGDEMPNKWHMTMPGAKRMQSLLQQMKKARCTYVVMEVPSEAQTQWRHIGIDFDVVLFTNVTREIMAAHNNSMDVLHRHNKRVFYTTEDAKRKVIDGNTIPKLFVGNLDDASFADYARFRFDKKVSFGMNTKSDFVLSDINIQTAGTSFDVNKEPYSTRLIGEVFAVNASAAIATATELGVSIEKIQSGLQSLTVIPGRMEEIDEGQSFTTYVDYAHDQVSLQKLLETGQKLASNKRVIVLFGGQGGGRDVEKRAQMGAIAAKLADYVVISNDDPYDDDPQEIIEDIAGGAKNEDMVLGKNLFCIEDRREGIQKALRLAQPGDVVFIACKGADQLMMVADGKSLPWDDRTVTREELQKLRKK